MTVRIRRHKPATRLQRFLEQYAARFETDPSCALCWWYRGLLSHSLVSVAGGFLLGWVVSQ